MANNIVLNPQAGDSLVLTQITAGVIAAQNQYGPTGFATVLGTITNGANNGLLGKGLVISGFVNGQNNGTFQILNSTATSLLINNPYAVAETHAALGAFLTQSFPSQYASRIENLWSNQGGDNAVVNAKTGDCLVAIVIGLKSANPFDLLHGSAPYTTPAGFGQPVGWVSGLNDYNANPIITDLANGTPLDIISTSVTTNVLTVTVEAGHTALTTGQSVLLSGTQESFLNGQTVVVLAGATSTLFTANFTHANYSNGYDTGTAAPAGNVWTLAANLNIADSDYTVAATPPVAPNPFPSAKWNIDGYYPSIYVYTAANVKAGSYNVNVDSMYQPGITAPADYSGGAVPIFDGGVNVQIYNLSGAAAAAVVESFSVSAGSPAEIASNPAVAPASLTVANANGDALISVALFKNSNAFSVGTVNVMTPPTTGPATGAALQQIGSGKLVGSEAHYLVGYALVTAAASPYQPNFANPLGYPALVASVAIKSS